MSLLSFGYFILLEIRLLCSKEDTILPRDSLLDKTLGTIVVRILFRCDQLINKNDEGCGQTNSSFQTVDRILHRTG